MPKIKSKKAATKRFRKNAAGKLKRRQAMTSHILTKMRTKRKRKLRKDAAVSKSDTKRVNMMMPY